MRNLIVLASTTALLVAGASPGHATTMATDTNTTVSTTHSGEDLFTGLLLGHGPVAEAYPELAAAHLTTETPGQQTEFINQLTDAITQQNPDFFDQFAAGLTSGDRVQVDQSLRNADTTLHTALTELDLAADQRADSQIGSLLWVGVFVVVAAVITAAAMINTVGNIDRVVNIGSAPNDSGLDYEKWVDRVAETLH